MKSTLDLITDFKNLHIGVIGDIIVDEYISGKVERISPEAPIPILNRKNIEIRPGGAANVSLNLMNLGIQTALFGVVGNDITGDQFIRLMNQDYGDISLYLTTVEHRITTLKTRVMAGSQHLVRIDHEETTPIEDTQTAHIIENIAIVHTARPFDAIIIQDYEKGVLHPGNISKILEFLQERKIKIIVDPKNKNFWYYKNVNIIKPNRSEAEQVTNSKITMHHQGLRKVSSYISDQLHNELTVITLSENGIYLSDRLQEEWLQAERQEIVDVCGAGDAVAAVIAAAYCSRASLYDIALLSNLAGSIVCSQSGVATINAQALSEAYNKR